MPTIGEEIRKTDAISIEQVTQALREVNKVLDPEEVLTLRHVVGKRVDLETHFRGLLARYHPDSRQQDAMPNEDISKKISATHELVRDFLRQTEPYPFSYERVAKPQDFPEDLVPYDAHQAEHADFLDPNTPEMSRKHFRFTQELYAFRQKNAKYPELLAMLNHPKTLKGMRALYLISKFNFARLQTMCDKYIFDRPDYGERIKVFYLFGYDPYFLCGEFPPKTPPPSYDTTYYATYEIETRFFFKIRTAKEAERERVLHTTISHPYFTGERALDAFEQFTLATNGGLGILAEVFPFDAQFHLKILYDVLKTHSAFLENYSCSLPLPSNYPNFGSWLFSKIYSLRKIMSSQYLQSLKAFVVTPIEAYRDQLLTQQKKLEAKQQKNSVKIKKIEEKVGLLDEVLERIQQTVMNMVREALKDGDFNNIELPDSRRYKKNPNHLQLKLEALLAEYADDPRLGKARNPVRDFFRKLLGVLVSIPTVLLLASGTYRKAIKQTFFQTRGKATFDNLVPRFHSLLFLLYSTKKLNKKDQAALDAVTNASILSKAPSSAA